MIAERTWAMLSVVVVLAVGAFYLAGVIACGEFGFPLDDGWIHQTYARSLAQTGRFAYGSVQASAGSTSPLWTLLLSLGYVLPISPFLWTYLLGAASWLLAGWTAAALAASLFPGQRSVARWIGLACLVEWHLAWAAFSGMETVLFILVSLLLIRAYVREANTFWLGVLGGALILTRPEGMVLVGMVGTALAAELGIRAGRRQATWRQGLPALVGMAAGLSLLLLPYLIYSQVTFGRFFPNTFYAKQAEYRVLLSQPIWLRVWTVLRRPLIGAQALLLPGFVYQVACLVRRCWRRAGQETGPGDGDLHACLSALLPAAWWAVYLGIYALRMPVDYQYGRYLMPTIPFLILYGIAGTAHWLRLDHPRSSIRVLSRAAALSIVCLFVAFIFIGGRTYGDDVRVIRGEMVDVALWLRDNTPPGALVAAHDIGALGYFSEHPLLDLAGLVTPDVIPFIRDEARLIEFVIEQGADYVVTFPSWYKTMVADDRLQKVYQTHCSITVQRGGDNMAVYRLSP